MLILPFGPFVRLMQISFVGPFCVELQSDEFFASRTASVAASFFLLSEDRAHSPQQASYGYTDLFALHRILNNDFRGHFPSTLVALCSSSLAFAFTYETYESKV